LKCRTSTKRLAWQIAVVLVLMRWSGSLAGISSSRTEVGLAFWRTWVILRRNISGSVSSTPDCMSPVLHSAGPLAGVWN
jgi:hypothetical protein